jgi:SAM-dependent methyltransferase
MFPESQICGIDISDVAIEKAQTRFPKYRFSSFDGTKAPFPDASFNLIYSYHVLEHVSDIEACISDISRMIKKDGYVCLIFPCGNHHSFEEKIMNLMENGKETSSAGSIVYFYETKIGHLRRMSSQETISLFNKNGLILVKQFYSNHFFGWLDWLTRGHFPRDINNMFLSRKPINFMAKLRLQMIRRMLLVLNRIIGLKSLDVSKKRKLPKQTTAFAIKTLAKSIDRLVVFFAFLEWLFCRHRPNGSAQYLVFKKSSN